MKRVVALIDGFNVYHALKAHPDWVQFKWLNYSKLVRCFVGNKDLVKGVYYFTALATWLPEAMARHKILIRALEMQGVEIVYGKFKDKDRICGICEKQYRSHEEKQTDVNIALYLFRLAVEDQYDTALIFSGDSDLVPAIKQVKRVFPSKELGVVIPIGRSAQELKEACSFHRKMKTKHLQDSMFENVIELGEGKQLVRPETWR